MNEQKQEISSSISHQLKAEAGLKRVFNVEQKSYFEKLKAEMAAIARNRTPRQMHAEKDLKSLREWVKRRGKMIEFLETKKMPEKEVQEAEMDVSVYSEVGAPKEISGKIAFKARNKEGKWVVVDESGEEISNEFDEIYKIKSSGENKFYVIAKTGQKYVRKVFDFPLAP